MRWVYSKLLQSTSSRFNSVIHRGNTFQRRVTLKDMSYESRPYQDNSTFHRHFRLHYVVMQGINQGKVNAGFESDDPWNVKRAKGSVV